MTTTEISGLSAMIAAAKIDEIHDVVSLHRKQFTNFGFSRGYLGVAVFHYLYALHTGQKRYMDDARRAFEQSCDMIDGDPQASYPQDFTDLGAVAQYLHRAGILDLDPNTFLGDVDAVLLKRLRMELRAGHIGSFASGALGYGLYFLHRSEYCHGNARTAIDELIEGILHHAVRVPGGCHWQEDVRPDPALPTPFFNDPSTAVLLFLARATESGLVPAEATAELVQDAVDWIANRDKNIYGQMGTGYALLRAGMAFSNHAWSARGRDMLRQCASQDWAEVIRREDAGVRCGATGLGIMFDRVAQLTNDPHFEDTAHYWFRQVLRFDLHRDGFAGYKVASQPWHAQTNLSFSQGIIGIGCGLFKALYPAKTDFNDLIWLL